MKEIIIFPFDLSSEFRDEDYIQGREMDLLQPGCTMEPKSFCTVCSSPSQLRYPQLSYFHSNAVLNLVPKNLS